MRTRTDGQLHVVCGPMFAGKSEELLRRVRRAQLAGLEVEVINHSLDQRHGAGQVASHSGLAVASHAVADVPSLLTIAQGRQPDLLAIDEAQFFGADLIPAVGELALAGLTVVVAGLCVTFDGRPFEPVTSLMALAEEVTKLTAVCAVCGADAAFHQRVLTGDVGDASVPTAAHVGGIESYQARCRRHFAPPA